MACAFNRSQPDLDVGALMKRATTILTDAEAAAAAAPFPTTYKAAWRHFELPMKKRRCGPDVSSKEGVEIPAAARKFWSREWTGRVSWPSAWPIRC
ncbi:MAG: hypothetical protein R3C58_03615 [Parvularculaceae bacterium]